MNPTPKQLKLLSDEQDWSNRYGDIYKGRDDATDVRTLGADPSSGSDVYLMHATVSVGIDDDHVWNAIQRTNQSVAEFTLAGSCDLSGTDPPGWVRICFLFLWQCNAMLFDVVVDTKASFFQK